MMVGDIVLVHTNPPHIASVTQGNMVICEDGTIMPFTPVTMSLLCNALDVIKELEKGVLGYDSSWRLCDSK